ncbi:MAG: iron transporter FeoB [Planctomycetes bacterium SM23_32]|nr:MAG: iron transporter FeoB [Planctomycetes bacterium SM23_32]
MGVPVAEHGARDEERASATARIALVGSPNVGKSVLFGNLTGIYVTVSNYPGTTVEVSRGAGRVGGRQYEVVDTPGMYSLLPLSEEEGVARSILMEAAPDVVIHVADAKNLRRMLLLTYQLIEAGLPLVLVLNMLDEAEARGLSIDARALEDELGVPVVGTVCTTGRGMDELRRRIAAGVGRPDADRFRYRARGGLRVEELLCELDALMSGQYPVRRRCLGLLLLQGDEEVHRLVERTEPDVYPRVRALVERARRAATQPVDHLLALERHRWATAAVDRAVTQGQAPVPSLSDRLGWLLVNPLTGIPVLILVLYLALYKFVGQFGAGTIVNLLEARLFESWINPPLTRLVEHVLPWPVMQELVVGEYGIVTLGLRYAVAIILPIVALFFLVFSFIEDVGYLPRLALLLDRVFKKLGLSGRAVIPMVLGFGCVTMATMVTRTLSSKRERMIATLLLSLAVPCSAQLGVIVGLLSGRPAALLTWGLVILGVYLTIGLLADRLFPGRSDPFYVEIPPLRWPRLGNIVTKTLARVKWYFMEVLPLFLIASVLIWLGRLTRLFDLIIGILEYPVRWIGMPPEAAKIFVLGFFRRDYGAAGLYDLRKAGMLNGVQLVVGAIALTLFLPCIAQFLMTAKERGWAASVAIAGAVFTIAFGVAFVVFHALVAAGVTP